MNNSHFEKIRIRILFSNFYESLGIKSFYKALCADDRYDVKIIITSSRKGDEGFKKTLISNGFEEYVYGEDYLVSEDKPDVTVLFYPILRPLNIAYEAVLQYFDDFRKYSKRIVAYDIFLTQYERDLEKHWNSSWYYAFRRMEPDYLLFDKVLYRRMKDAGISVNKLVEMGNPKFDMIREFQSTNKNYPKGWEKLKGRKIISIITTHGYGQEGFKQGVAFDLYIDDILRFARENSNVGIIFRPHNSLFRELVNCNIWSEERVQSFKEECKNSDNLVYDNTISYNGVVSLSDGILMDCFCGAICSLLPTLIPIGILYRYDMDVEAIHTEITDAYYSIRGGDDLNRFFEMILKSEDPMFQIRKANAIENVCHYDGENGDRLKTFIDTII